MLGAITGDLIGSAYERHNTDRYDFELFPPGATFTDDTVLTVAVMDHILNRTDLAVTFRKWCQRYPHAGYGPGFLAWLGGQAAGRSRGNGAAMRVSPFAWVPYEMEEMYKATTAQARLTHDSKDALYATQTVASAIRFPRDGYGRKTLITLLEAKPTRYKGLRWPPRIKRPGSLAKESVPVALAAALNSSSFEDSIRKAVSIGGDSDTIAAITGAVAEAIYGKVPDQLLSEVRQRLPLDLLEVIDEFYDRWIGPAASHPFSEPYGNSSEKSDKVTSTTGPQTPKEKPFSLKELSPDDPIYTRGFRIGVVHTISKKVDS